MLRTTLASSRVLRVCVFGLVTAHHRGHFHNRHRRCAPLPASLPCLRPRHHQRGARKLQPAILLHHRRRQFRRDPFRQQSRREPPSGFAHQDHDALSAVRASRRRQDEARHRNAGVRACLRAGAHQTRPAPGPDHPRRRRHQGTGDALGQRRRRRDRGSHRRRRRRFRQADDPQGARARHEPDGLSQCLRPARRRTGDDGARSVDARPRHPGSLSALLPLFLDRGVQLSRPVRSATTITCSAASRASTASRPATPAPPASIS